MTMQSTAWCQHIPSLYTVTSRPSLDATYTLSYGSNLFESRTGYPLSWLQFFVIALGFSWDIQRCHFEIGRDVFFFVPNHSLSMVIFPSRTMLYNLCTWSNAIKYPKIQVIMQKGQADSFKHYVRRFCDFCFLPWNKIQWLHGSFVLLKNIYISVYNRERERERERNATSRCSDFAIARGFLHSIAPNQLWGPPSLLTCRVLRFFGFPTEQGIPWPDEWLTCQECICSVKSVRPNY
jgi:hypothetical protein